LVLKEGCDGSILTIVALILVLCMLLGGGVGIGCNVCFKAATVGDLEQQCCCFTGVLIV
jgi:hypothetical protein